MDLQAYQSLFFVGIAGTGMSAIAQYLCGCGKTVSGSDRLFASGSKSTLQQQFEDMGITCAVQDGSGIDESIDLVVVSTAIEESNVEYQKALQLGIPIAKRSAVLAAISDQTKTIAVGGTSGKSTTTAMIFHILNHAGLQPSLITGAGLTELQEQGLPGNAYKGQGEWLVIEADESDGSIVGYHPEISVVLNVERDHKEADELLDLFSTFKENTNGVFIVNADNELAASLSFLKDYDFSAKGAKVGVKGSSFKQSGFGISFKINGSSCKIPVLGEHNMENALAAFAVCKQVGVKKEDIIKLGSNENPWGPSPKAIEAIKNELDSINRYPESQLKELVHLAADYSDVKDSQVIIGGDGADEIIDVLAKTFIEPGDEFIVPLPSYMYYEYLLKQYGAKPVYARWDLEKNVLDVQSIYDKITPKSKMIFLKSKIILLLILLDAQIQLFIIC